MRKYEIKNDEDSSKWRLKFDPRIIIEQEDETKAKKKCTKIFRKLGTHILKKFIDTPPTTEIKIRKENIISYLDYTLYRNKVGGFIQSASPHETPESVENNAIHLKTNTLKEIYNTLTDEIEEKIKDGIKDIKNDPASPEGF